MKVCVLDTETTSLDLMTGKVIDVCGLEFANESATPFYRRCHPQIPIPEESRNVHGITDEDVIGCPVWAQVADDFKSYIETFDVIAGHNVDFDLRMLKQECEKVGLHIDWPKIVVCTLKLWRKHEPPPERNLQAAYKRFINPDGFEGAHGAVADVRATGKVLEAMRSEFKLTDTAWEDLDPNRLIRFGGSHHFKWTSNEQVELICTFGKWEKKSVIDIDNGYWRFIQDKDFPSGVKALARRCTEANKNTAWGRDMKAAYVYEWARNQ